MCPSFSTAADAHVDLLRVLVAAMLRITRGLIATVESPAGGRGDDATA
ncbi:hypothetical protein [Streptomyces sp. NPDC101150]